jgi:hypothetical protein
MAVRLPRIPGSVGRLLEEVEWLPRLGRCCRSRFPSRSPKASRVAAIRSTGRSIGGWTASQRRATSTSPKTWLRSSPRSRVSIRETGRLRGSTTRTAASLSRGAIRRLGPVPRRRRPGDGRRGGGKVLSGERRERFRAAPAVDDATWERSRGWALSQALIALAYYTLETNATLVLEARRWLAEVLE